VRSYWKFVLPATFAVAALVLLGANLSSSLVYFHTPTELRQQAPGDGRLRLGGQVVPGSVTDTADGVIFDVTDGRVTVSVQHTGAPQQLFQEGVGVVVEGTWDGDAFHSDTMLVKHNETYRTEDGSTYDPEHPYGADSDGS
jgi:cytochrome c-type biogenesis protein CcmE